MKFENTEVFNFEGALRGMRNPLNSWYKSDSHYWLPNEHMEEYEKMANEDVSWTPYFIGADDMKLARKLIVGGSEHSKFMRQILVSVDITGPLFWWKQMETYKVGTTANSTSTMHKLSSTPITRECFDMSGYDGSLNMIDPCHIDTMVSELISFLEQLRQKYIQTGDKAYWTELVRWLPEGWLQTRTWTANYAVLKNIYFQRKNHRLEQWQEFCRWIEGLPYGKELITDTEIYIKYLTGEL